MWCQLRNAKSSRVLFHDVPDDFLRNLQVRGVAQAVFANNAELRTVPQLQSDRKKHGSIKFWNINSGKVIRQITAAPDSVHYFLDVNSSGTRVLGYVGKEKRVENFNDSVDQRFRIWDLASGKVVATSPDLPRPNQSELPK